MRLALINGNYRPRPRSNRDDHDNHIPKVGFVCTLLSLSLVRFGSERSGVKGKGETNQKKLKKYMYKTGEKIR